MEITTTTAQAAQSKGIYREAMALQRDGWYVMADHIPGFIPPPEFEGYVPDIYAIKDEKSSIIVIETSFDEHSGQIAALREYAGHYSNITFYGWVVDEAGCRIARIE
jgi:hypothetical protein